MAGGAAAAVVIRQQQASNSNNINIAAGDKHFKIGGVVKNDNDEFEVKVHDSFDDLTPWRRKYWQKLPDYMDDVFDGCTVKATSYNSYFGHIDVIYTGERKVVELDDRTNVWMTKHGFNLWSAMNWAMIGLTIVLALTVITAVIF